WCAVPGGVVSIAAFDWYCLRPLRNVDWGTVLVLGRFMGMSVIVGAVATQAGRRAAGSEQAQGVLAGEQAALRRVATLVARQPSPPEGLAAGAGEAGRPPHPLRPHLLLSHPRRARTGVGARN